MTKAKLAFLFPVAALSLLSACNLRMAQQIDPPSSASVVVSIQVATEYRSGPGESYEVVGMLDPGVSVEAVGRNPEGEYLLVRLPGDPPALRWLKSQLVTAAGDVSGLPIAAPPAPPSPVSSGLSGGCPTPIGGGPTPVACGDSAVAPPSAVGCPSPVGGGPTPVTCGASEPVGGCPTPIGGGPTPVSCGYSAGAPPASAGCPTPIGGGPTPVTCGYSAGAQQVSGGCPTPIGGGPTPVNCRAPVGNPVRIRAATPLAPTSIP